MRTKEANEIKMPIFRERFCSLRGSKTQAEFAEFIGISRPTVGFYENGERLPDALVLRKIAKKCRVSVDWLLGLSEIKKIDITEKAIQKELSLSGKSIQAIRDLAIIPRFGNGDRPMLLSTTFPLSFILDSFLSDESFALWVNKIAFAINCGIKSKKTTKNHDMSKYIELCQNSGEFQVLHAGQAKRYEIFEIINITQAILDNVTNKIEDWAIEGEEEFYQFLADNIKGEEPNAPYSIKVQNFILTKGGEQNANDHTEERDI